MRYTPRILLVESISISRLMAALVFSSLAFQSVPLWVITGMYLFAMCSDLLDGYLARRLKVTTYFGKIIDLVSDKSLTIVSLLYAAARGISIFALSLIAAREIIMIGARTIVVDGKQLLPTNKLLGGVLACVLWSNTLFLVVAVHDTGRLNVANMIYWACSIFFIANLLTRLYVSAPRIMAALMREQ